MMTIAQRVTVTVLAIVGGGVIVGLLLTLAYFMIPKAHATDPFVTHEPGDQKANMGLYDDAKGPPWYGIPVVGVASMPWGSCSKPGVVVGVDRHGNGIFAADDEVIWRCLQLQPPEAPLVYCHLQKDQPSDIRFGLAWRCYHDYSVVFDFYEHEYGRSPLMLPDEIEFVETEIQ